MPDHTAPESPIETVRRFLALVEERDLGAATEMLDPSVVITFPGGRTFRGLGEQVASAAGRYEYVRKSFDGFDVVDTDANTAVVYAFGTLAGRNLAGEDFSGIRFIDRFTIAEGLIVDQTVWNDLAESGVI